MKKIVLLSLCVILSFFLMGQTSESVLAKRLLSVKNIYDSYDLDIQINDEYTDVIDNLKKYGLKEYDISVDDKFTTVNINNIKYGRPFFLIFFSDKASFITA